MPKVSIGIPIYYGELFLEETLISIFSQEYSDFEIIISDNNPGGKPQKIAEKYAREHENVTYIIHDENIGALQNWNYTIKISKGKYFILAGAHDLWSHNFLPALVEKLDNSPNAVLVHAPVEYISEKGEKLGYTTNLIDTSQLSDIERFNALFWMGHDALYGLIRMSAIKKTNLQKEIVGSGAVWLSELILQGHFLTCNTVTRYRRINRKKQSREEQLSRYYKTLFSKKKIRILPFWRFWLAYFGSIYVVRIGFRKQVRLFISILINFPLRFGINLFYLDIKSFITRLFTGRLQD